MAANQVVLFQSSDGAVSLPVQFESENVWLTQAQMAQLFGKDRSVISRHIQNAINEGEVDPSTGCANFAYPEKNISGIVKIVAYNLDFIISVGYRVHSLRGVEFRRWATSVLKEYVLRGYAINRKRLVQLGQAVEVMKRVSNSLDTEQVLDVVKSYSAALPTDLVEVFERLSFPRPKPLPVMKLAYQIAQKLHAVSESGSERAHDLIDLQLICNRSRVDYAEVKSVCRRLFDYRRRQPWPAVVTVLPSWDDLYVLARNNLLENGDVLPTAAEAVAWTNELVQRIEESV